MFRATRRKRSWRCIVMIVTASLIGLPATSASAADARDSKESIKLGNLDRAHGWERHGWRFEFANDAFVGSDSQFTSGIWFQKHSYVSDSIDDLDGVPALGNKLAKAILPAESGLLFRKALGIGQSMGTPSDKRNPALILDDTPYFAFLGFNSSWLAFNDTKLTILGLTTGVVGQYAFGEAVQEAVHSLNGSTDPQGWDHQLDDEPVLNVHFGKKRKVFNRAALDIAISGDLSLGNYMTGASSGVEIRAGRKPDGFAYVSDPLGGGPFYDATIPQREGGDNLYMTLVARVWAWGVFMPLDGNTLVSGNEWTEQNTIEPKHFVGQAVVGAHYNTQSWGMHLTWAFNSDTVDPGSLAPESDRNDDFGSLTVEWRF